MPVRRARSHIDSHTYKGRIQRDMRLDNVRGILIMIVVIGHFLLPLTRTRFVTGLIYAIYIFHMPCFIMVSGYFAKSVYRNGHFRWGKIVQLLWLYFVYKSVVNITEGLIAGHIPLLPDYFHESGAPWYLMSLATYYMTIPVFDRFKRDPLHGFLTVAVMMLAVSFGKYVIHVGDLFSFDRTFTLLPFFYIGYYGSQGLLDRFLLSPLRRPTDILALFFWVAAFFGTYDFFMKYHLVVYGADYTRYLPEMHGYLWALNLLWYFIASIVSMGLIGMTLNRRMAVFTDLGRHTLQIYFLHRPIRDLMQYFGFYEMVDANHKTHVIFVVALSALLTIILGNDLIAPGFAKLRSVFDPLLEKYNAL